MGVTGSAPECLSYANLFSPPNHIAETISGLTAKAQGAQVESTDKIHQVSMLYLIIVKAPVISVYYIGHRLYWCWSGDCHRHWYGEPATRGAPHVVRMQWWYSCHMCVLVGVQVKLQDLMREGLGMEGVVVAHFVAHAEPDVHIAALAFNPRYVYMCMCAICQLHTCTKCMT